VNRLKIVVFGEQGDDRVNVRDRTADVAFGGEGNDTAVADPGNLDVLNGFESIDRTPNAVPPPVTPPHVTPPPFGKPDDSRPEPCRTAARRPVTRQLDGPETMTTKVAAMRAAEVERAQLSRQCGARAQRAEQVRIAAPTAHPASASAIGDARTW